LGRQGKDRESEKGRSDACSGKKKASHTRGRREETELLQQKKGGENSKIRASGPHSRLLKPKERKVKNGEKKTLKSNTRKEKNRTDQMERFSSGPLGKKGGPDRETGKGKGSQNQKSCATAKRLDGRPKKKGKKRKVWEGESSPGKIRQTEKTITRKKGGKRYSGNGEREEKTSANGGKKEGGKDLKEGESEEFQRKSIEKRRQKKKKKKKTPWNLGWGKGKNFSRKKKEKRFTHRPRKVKKDSAWGSKVTKNWAASKRGNVTGKNGQKKTTLVRYHSYKRGKTIQKRGLEISSASCRMITSGMQAAGGSPKKEKKKCEKRRDP